MKDNENPWVLQCTVPLMWCSGSRHHCTPVSPYMVQLFCTKFVKFGVFPSNSASPALCRGGIWNWWKVPLPFIRRFLKYEKRIMGQSRSSISPHICSSQSSSSRSWDPVTAFLISSQNTSFLLTYFLRVTFWRKKNAWCTPSLRLTSLPSQVRFLLSPSFFFA